MIDRMTMIDYIQYDWWPRMKLRLLYYWWVLRYGGKKRIPREIVFGALARSVARMQEDLRKAQEDIPLETMNEDERLMLRQARINADQFAVNVETVFHREHNPTNISISNSRE